MTGPPQRHTVTASATGRFYDGRTSARSEVQLRNADGRLQVTGTGVAIDVPLQDCRFMPQVGSVRPAIMLPGGGRCELDDDGALDRLRGSGAKSGFAVRIHRWERNIIYASAALVITIVVVWGGITYGIPAIAERAAFALPPDVERSLGTDTLVALDRIVLTPAALPPAQRDRIASIFARVTGGDGRYRLELRHGNRIGANAFALPGGTVVITDELVGLARDDDEIAAVLAHELGHHTRRHALRTVLQNSAATLVVATLTGDIVSVTSLAAALPVTLVEARYSRTFEREADDAALAWLRAQGIPASRYADILARLQASHDHGGKEGAAGPFSTHPGTDERIRRAGDGR